MHNGTNIGLRVKVCGDPDLSKEKKNFFLGRFLSSTHKHIHMCTHISQLNKKVRTKITTQENNVS